MSADSTAPVEAFGPDIPILNEVHLPAGGPSDILWPIQANS